MVYFKFFCKKNKNIVYNKYKVFNRINYYIIFNVQNFKHNFKKITWLLLFY